MSTISAQPTRRDFLYIATGTVGAIGAAATLIPLIAQMNPDASTIAAGAPIEAVRDSSNSIEIPPSMLGRGEHFALEVAGDSMIEAGIFDGDTVVVQRSETAENGTIVVALVDENEVTLKRLRRRGASIALEPANKTYETRIFGPDRVRIQGKAVGLLRKL